MSKKNKSGAWVIPQEQVKEFTAGPINYRELIEDCLKPKVGVVEVKQKKSFWSKR